MTAAAFAAALALGLLGALAGMAAPRRVRPFVAGSCTAASGGAGVVAGVAALTGHPWTAWLPHLLPLAGTRLAIDPLGGLFIAVTGAVGVCAGVYGIAYARPLGRAVQAVTPLFLAAMLLVPAAASVSTFLLAWELMAVASLLLVLAEHRHRASVREAGLWYAVMTQAGLVALLGGLVGFAAAAHGESFARLREAGHALSPGVRAAVFLAVFAGCASKAGIVPLHVWLPRAHPEAPAHVSALMSAAMVNLGVYGVVRVGFDLLGGGPVWWWLVVLAAGAASALYGILQAVVATGLKRLLAYSTCENMGLVLIGTGAAGLLAHAGAHTLAALALTAALLHVVNHAAFKTVLFLAAGSVVRAAGTGNLDALGGLRTRMPVTTVLFGVGALGASALPLGSGFVSEWLLLQGLIKAHGSGGTPMAVTMPLAVAVVALTAGLAVATFVKAFGVGFLARPRSDQAGSAAEVPDAMLLGGALAAACCVLLALVPAAVVPGVARAVRVLVPGPDAVTGAATLRLHGVASTLSPLWIAVALAVALAVLRLGVARRARRKARLWDCGMGPLSARMEYTATSFAEPLQRVFENVLAPETGVHVTPLAESSYLVERVTYRARVGDRIERRLYRPVIAAAARCGEGARRLANGSVHRYLGYGFCAFTGVLIVLAVTR
ncbi:proton-conducting transporter transmembrane domain-containing protein [Actinomadura rupiterrae]|uniref:proton-conducting transporter transmembrane domain-containing protein n=1 Tax=Actinomadura rupiterrae TaxID=559627 RepID=UPI0020A554F0|nr:proton-conducting transporter membrane subunit [Actinomadura rupiterrae]MCP2342500.1 formate hydrogenlyase subunit 3/multisubunit Na+/H+ antiporter MnhD subunit [Actinomadura rupiterrae]